MLQTYSLVLLISTGKDTKLCHEVFLIHYDAGELLELAGDGRVKSGNFADFRSFELASRPADASERGALATAIGKGCEAGWCLWPSFRHWACCAQNPFVLVDYGRQETPKAPCLTKM